jgi:hypothetical protein
MRNCNDVKTTVRRRVDGSAPSVAPAQIARRRKSSPESRHTHRRLDPACTRQKKSKKRGLVRKERSRLSKKRTFVLSVSEACPVARLRSERREGQRKEMRQEGKKRTNAQRKDDAGRPGRKLCGRRVRGPLASSKEVLKDGGSGRRWAEKGFEKLEEEKRATKDGGARRRRRAVV